MEAPLAPGESATLLTSPGHEFVVRPHRESVGTASLATMEEVSRFIVRADAHEQHFHIRDNEEL